MTELYVFRGTTGHAEIVTNDKSGKNRVTRLDNGFFPEL
jgi:hypothetical protein